MSDQSAIRLLQAAIESVRENCTDPEYKALLAACDQCDTEAEKALKQDAADAAPRDMKGAAAKGKQILADARKTDDSYK